MHRLTSHAELLDRSGDDPWVRFALDPRLPGEAWVHDGVALIERPGRHRRGLWVAPLRPGMPPPASADELASEGARVRAALRALRDGGHLERLDLAAVSVPQEHADVAHAELELGEGGDWDWMWTTTAPPKPTMAVVEIDDAADAEEICAFTHAHNPRVWTEVGTGLVHHWLGVRDDGRLVAVGGAETEASGVPHLAGIVTDSARRGEGLATAVSAHLTRWALAGHGACTLGMFSDNAAARRVYHRLGYRTARAWHSRQLVRP